MELWNSAASLALRSAVRFASGIAHTARALGDLGERLELAAERQAHVWWLIIEKVLEPLIANAKA
ncbi:hypothetical protein ABIB94_004264 [Bradyrhizobium sp. JR7.2]|uniref:hypothetical protein n=1 Tax=Bradyrhizobium sp. JR7.2 TaxID=3156375 RepID=UPI00339B92F8